MQGSGTLADPYIITTTAEFASVGGASYYALGNDLDFTGVTYACKSTTTVNLDGRGYTIANLTQTSGAYGGLFSGVGTCSVRNLVLENFDISGITNQAGCLFASSNAGNKYIDNVNVVSGIVRAIVYAGGLIGFDTFASGKSAEITNCNINADVLATGAGGIAGGVCGGVEGTTGTTAGFIKYCTVAGIIRGDVAGGVAGRAGKSSSARVLISDNIVNASEILGFTHGGGIVGKPTTFGFLTLSNNVANCPKITRISGVSAFFGRIMGDPTNVVLSANYAIDSMIFNPVL